MFILLTRYVRLWLLDLVLRKAWVSVMRIMDDFLDLNVGSLGLQVFRDLPFPVMSSTDGLTIRYMRGCMSPGITRRW